MSTSSTQRWGLRAVELISLVALVLVAVLPMVSPQYAAVCVGIAFGGHALARGMAPSNPSVPVPRCTCPQLNIAGITYHEPGCAVLTVDPLDAARRHYMAADPLDPSATLSFLMAADGTDERERSPKSPSKLSEQAPKGNACLPDAPGSSGAGSTAGDALLAAHRTGCVTATVGQHRWRVVNGTRAEVWMWQADGTQEVMFTRLSPTQEKYLAYKRRRIT